MSIARSAGFVELSVKFSVPLASSDEFVDDNGGGTSVSVGRDISGSADISVGREISVDGDILGGRDISGREDGDISGREDGGGIIGPGSTIELLLSALFTCAIISSL